MNTSEVLYRAADLIEERGWTQGDGWVTEGNHADAELCLEGGIMAALGLTIREGASDLQFAPLLACPAYKAVNSFLDREEATVDDGGFGGQPLYWWNDDHGRSAEDVVAVLRSTAVIEAAKESANDHEQVSA